MLKFIIDPKESLHCIWVDEDQSECSLARRRNAARTEYLHKEVYDELSIANIGSKSAITMGKVDGFNVQSFDQSMACYKKEFEGVKTLECKPVKQRV